MSRSASPYQFKAGPTIRSKGVSDVNSGTKCQILSTRSRSDHFFRTTLTRAKLTTPQTRCAVYAPRPATKLIPPGRQSVSPGGKVDVRMRGP